MPDLRISVRRPGVADLDTILGNLRPGVAAIVARCRLARRRARSPRRSTDCRGLDAVHVIAHGAPGRVIFAAGEWSAATSRRCAEDLAAIGRALAADGELRLWSCDAGAGDRRCGFRRAPGAGGRRRCRRRLGRVGAAAMGGTMGTAGALRARGSPPPLSAAGIAGYAAVFATSATVPSTGTTEQIDIYGPSLSSCRIPISSLQSVVVLLWFSAASTALRAWQAPLPISYLFRLALGL